MEVILKSTKREWGTERGKERNRVSETLMSGLPLWASDAQPARDLGNHKEYASELPQGAVRKLGVYPVPLSPMMAFGTCS